MIHTVAVLYRKNLEIPDWPLIFPSDDVVE